MGSNAESLAEMEKLRKEERILCELINTLKSQLNKLKVEELSLTSKVRQQKGLVRTNLPSQATYNAIEDVNAIELDLTVKNDLLNKLARGGAELLRHSDEEEEDDDDALEMVGELKSGQNHLINFLDDLEN